MQYSVENAYANMMWQLGLNPEIGHFFHWLTKSSKVSSSCLFDVLDLAGLGAEGVDGPVNPEVLTSGKSSCHTIRNKTQLAPFGSRIWA